VCQLPVFDLPGPRGRLARLWRRRCSGCGRARARWLASSWRPRRGSRTISVTAMKEAQRGVRQPHERRAAVSHGVIFAVPSVEA
jgi:hypothetical protein